MTISHYHYTLGPQLNWSVVNCSIITYIFPAGRLVYLKELKKKCANFVVISSQRVNAASGADHHQVCLPQFRSNYNSIT